MGRRCDGCTLCCVMTTVPELEKPTGIICKHCDHGCKIYSKRPASCQSFACGWLRGDLPKWAKPDKIHVMLERLSNHFVLAVPEPGYEGGWRTERVTDMLIDTYQKNGTAVMSLPDGRALIPEGHSVEEVTAALRFFAKRQSERVSK